MPRPRKPETQALGLRLPVALAERVRAAAEANGRTWNAQVVHLIEAGFDGDAKARTTVAEAWGDSLARSAACAAADAARDAVLRVAREFDESFAEAKARDAVLQVEAERRQGERRVSVDDPDPALPEGVAKVDVYRTEGGKVKLGKRAQERRAGSTV